MSRVRSASGVLLVAGLACLGCGGEAPAAAEPGVAPARLHAAQRVRAAPVEHGRLAGLSDVSAVTSAFRTATVAAEAAGRIVERHVEPGTEVAAGDPLVSLDETLLAIAVDEARATLKARQVDLAEAQRELERGSDLRREGAMSERQHDALRFGADRAESARALAAATLRRTRRSLDDAVVRAPFDGTVEEIDVQVGDYLVPGAPVAVVADFERLRLRAGVTATEAAVLRPGMTASVVISALGGVEVAADVHSVGRMADAASGTYPVELWLESPDPRLRGGMVGQLRLAAPEDAQGALVPRAALLRREDGLSVFVVEGSGDALHAAARRVRVGRQSGAFVEVLGGVEVGERVVVEGQFALTDGTPIYVDAAEPEAPESQAAWND